MTSGIRRDVPVEAILRWIWRVSFSLATEPGSPADGGDEGVLRTFLLSSAVAARPRSDRET